MLRLLLLLPKILLLGRKNMNAEAEVRVMLDHGPRFSVGLDIQTLRIARTEIGIPADAA